jgi:hypothetical protein
MNPTFGQDGQRVLALITGIADLTAEEVDQGTELAGGWCRIESSPGTGYRSRVPGSPWRVLHQAGCRP